MSLCDPIPHALARGDTVILTEIDSSDSKTTGESPRNGSQCHQRPCRMAVSPWATARAPLAVSRGRDEGVLHAHRRPGARCPPRRHLAGARPQQCPQLLQQPNERHHTMHRPRRRPEQLYMRSAVDWYRPMPALSSESSFNKLLFQLACGLRSRARFGALGWGRRPIGVPRV